MKTTVTGEFDDHDHENHEKEIEAFHNGGQHMLLFMKVIQEKRRYV